MITDEEILEILRKKDLSKYLDPSSYEPLGKALWVLMVVKDNTPIKRVSDKCISFILSELKEIPLSEKSISKAFSRANDKINRHKQSGIVYYEIMKSGRNYLKNLSEISKNVYFFSGKEAWTDTNKIFPQILKQLEGELLIVDPYYGIGTLFSLEKFGKDKKIRFLTGAIGREENEEKFRREFNTFKVEFKNIEIKRYEKYYELHDRYIVAQNALVVIGHGIKDIGSKESFVIIIFKEVVGEEFLSVLKEIFEERWKKAVNI